MKALPIALAAALAGCSATPVQPPVQVSQPAIMTATGKALIYLSDYSQVDVYDYETTTLVRSLTGFQHASGSCSDSSGNVYVSNTGDADVLEFPHGVTKPNYVYDPYPDPVDCSIDARTGNLAVVNEFGLSESSPGNVAIYTKAKGKPTIFKSTFATQWLSAAYDAKGDLLVSGYANNTASFAVLPAAGSKLESVTLQRAGTQPSYVRWDGEYFVVESEGTDSSPIFVMYTLNGTTGTEEGYMQVNHATEGAGPFWLGIVGGPKNLHRANQLVASINGSGATFWDYPEGGAYIFRLGYEYDYGGVTVTTK